ncbi:MAG: hypothetical protein Kow00114_40530 [Kiloniellaceae bacterium]
MQCNMTATMLSRSASPAGNSRGEKPRREAASGALPRCGEWRLLAEKGSVSIGAAVTPRSPDTAGFVTDAA